MLKYLFLKDIQANELSKKEAGLYWATLLFFITLFIAGKPVINNISIGVLFIFCMIFNSRKEKMELLAKRKAVWAMIAFYILHMLSFLWSANKHEAGVMLGMRVPLLIFPLAFGLIEIRPALRARILYSFSVVLSLVAVFCLVVATYNFNHSKDSGYFYNDLLGDVLKIQSIYIAMIVNCVLFGIGWLLSYQQLPVVLRPWLYVAIAILLPFHFLLASRMAIIVLYAAVFAFIGWNIVAKKRWLQGAGALSVVLLLGFLLFRSSPKTFNRFHELMYTGYDIKSEVRESHYNSEFSADQWNGANLRLAVWNCGLEAASSNWLIGTGLGDKMDEMMEIYRKKGFAFGIKTKRNLHNNYLDSMVCFGVIGLFLLVTGWIILPLIAAWKNRNIWAVAIIFSFAMSFISETYFDRSIGNVLTGFFICFVIANLPTGNRKTVSY
jgi:O-antigen ligase